MENNRRVRMTKKLIFEAFLELLEKNPIEKISISDVCRDADVNRSTFYKYYSDLPQVLSEIENETLDMIPVITERPVKNADNSGFLEKLEEFFTYVKENERVFRILVVNSDNSNFNRRLVEVVMQKYVNENDVTDERVIKYSYVYVVSGVIGILRKWISEGFQLSVKDFSKLVFEMSLRAYDIADVRLSR